MTGSSFRSHVVFSGRIEVMTSELELMYIPPRNGETLILTCLLSPHFASKGSKYSWKKNSVAIPADRKPVVYSTEVPSQLHIPRASAKLDSGQYECGVQSQQDFFTVSSFVYFNGELVENSIRYSSIKKTVDRNTRAFESLSSACNLDS